MQITLAQFDDLAALSGLLAELFAQEAEFQPDPERQLQGLRYILADPTVGEILVARDETGVHGMVSLLYSVSTALGSRVAWLEDMVVSQTARSQGVGSALIETAIEHARSRGCARITLLTDGDNHAAQRFYTRHGFVASPMAPWRRLLD